MKALYDSLSKQSELFLKDSLSLFKTMQDVIASEKNKEIDDNSLPDDFPSFEESWDVLKLIIDTKGDYEFFLRLKKTIRSVERSIDYYLNSFMRLNKLYQMSNYYIDREEPLEIRKNDKLMNEFLQIIKDSIE